jgi:thiamine biosynthesis lipoprotein
MTAALRTVGGTAVGTGDPALTAAADWQALGTQVRLVLTDPGALGAARADLAGRLDLLDRTCSRFRPDSELRRLDPHRGGPVPISPLLAELVEAGLRAARLTDGDVDPTLGTAMQEAGYDRTFRLVAPDGPALRIVAGPAAGWRAVQLDRERCLLTVPTGVLLDLGATAKAWAADDAAGALADRFGCGVLVSLGGDIAVAGQAPEGGWNVRVQDAVGHPDLPAIGPSAMVSVASGGLATSSVSARRWVRGGAPMHHVLDPRTGMPAQSPWRTVSVAAASCVDANVASTAAIVRGHAAPGMLRGLRLPARLVATDGAVTTVAGWPS